MRLLHDTLLATVFQIIGMAIHRARANNSHTHMTHMHTQQVGSMDMAALRLLHNVLYATVFQIIGIAAHGKGEDVWYGSCGNSTGWGP